MPRLLQWGFAFLIVALVIGAPIGYAIHVQARLRCFRVVKDGVLYRSGQNTLAGLQQILHDYGIKTVITLRDPSGLGEGSPDGAEEAYCIAEELNFVRIPPRSWDNTNGTAPAEEGVRRFRAIMADPDNYPVLVHCFAGIHRSGAFCAIYRMEHDHWTNAEAIAELKACGYDNLEDEWDILGYLETYQPTWKAPEDRLPSAEQRPAVAPNKKVKPRGKKSAG
jgi:protein tyrosine/serine phosphatase